MYRGYGWKHLISVILGIKMDLLRLIWAVIELYPFFKQASFVGFGSLFLGNEAMKEHDQIQTINMIEFVVLRW